MPLIATRGAASAQGFGEFASSSEPVYIESCFSTYLYTGNGSTQTFNNGVDLSTKGGMVWIKQRSSPAEDWRCVDSARGITNGLQQNLTNAQQDWTGLGYVTAFNTNGFSIGSNVSINTSAYTYASWTFRKQPKFFDVVTYTGNGVAGRTIAHNLGSEPGCIIFKRTDSTSDWAVYHRSLNGGSGPEDFRIFLNTTAAQTSGPSYTVSAVSSTTITLGGDGAGGGSTLTNVNGATYVAYLFAHNAGGFGLTGTDNVISCGSYTGNGSTTGPVVTLGYEPQLVMVKRTDAASNWTIFDTMRGMSQTSANLLYPNLADDEGIGTQGWVVPTATGFQLAITQSSVNANGGTYIYIAIRRGPMKTPTSGTSVFTPTARTGTGAAATFTGAGFPVDSSWIRYRGSLEGTYLEDRLRGANRPLDTTSTSSETVQTQYITGFDSMTGYGLGTNSGVNASSSTYINWDFRRAPGFFDVVCYTGTGVARTVTHNLGVVPELMIVKNRNNAENWGVYSAALGNTKRLRLNSTDASVTASAEWNNTSPTASVFTVGTDQEVNFSGNTYVNYLFASCPGVSKVGSYTGTGTTLQVNCGFTGGARFVLIKRTDSTGDWYVWDSARGIVAGNDPYLLLNSTAAEVTNTDYVDIYSAGFEISSTAPAAINANGGTYIFLAIA
jgi:hypothetical protein